MWISKKKLDKMIAARINMALSQHGKGCHTIYFGDGYEYTTTRVLRYVLDYLNLKITTTPSKTTLTESAYAKTCSFCDASLLGADEINTDFYVCKCGTRNNRRP